jgi:CheY-like chemotaxis protein
MARILVVEDEVVIAMMVELWLADLGHELIGPAPNAATASALIEGGGIDAAILDVSLEGVRSYGIADALRTKGIPFAWGTGYSSRDIDARYRDAPIIAKPYSLEDFTRVVGALVAKGVCGSA